MADDAKAGTCAMSIAQVAFCPDCAPRDDEPERWRQRLPHDVVARGRSGEPVTRSRRPRCGVTDLGVTSTPASTSVLKSLDCPARRLPSDSPWYAALYHGDACLLEQPHSLPVASFHAQRPYSLSDPLACHWSSRNKLVLGCP